MQNPDNASPDAHPYSTLSPDLVIDAIESTGRSCDARVFALNSYENRVYQIGIEDDVPIIAKFYRPQRWSDAQIREEHAFSAELFAAELPIVAPVADETGETLFTHAGFRFALFRRKGGQAAEPGDTGQLHRIGTLLGRIHAIARAKNFTERPALDIDRLLDQPRAVLRDNGFVPPALESVWTARIDLLREKISALFAEAHANNVAWIRTQGDCHAGNIVWTRDDGPWFVDFDDCQSAPAVQDLWMLLAGSRREQELSLAEIIDGYEMFSEFDVRELRLVEALRALRVVHHAGWIAQRWDDPAFPRAFPWFNTPRWWQSHLAALEEQVILLDEEPLRRL